MLGRRGHSVCELLVWFDMQVSVQLLQAGSAGPQQHLDRIQEPGASRMKVHDVVTIETKSCGS